MARNIEQIKSALILGGARPSLFEVSLDSAGALSDIAPELVGLKFLCRAAQLPASTLGTIEVPYQGRKIKVAGDRTFAEWTITIMNDENFVLRDAFLKWSNYINGHFSNTREGQATSAPSTYKGEAVVTQLSKNSPDAPDGGNGIRAYRFIGCWPSEVSAIDLDWGTNDTIEEFSVTFQHDYWLPYASGSTGDTSPDAFNTTPQR